MKLIFHIGTGKTGSSSIQFTLKNGQDALKDAGVRYLGVILEHAENLHPWQYFGGNGKLHVLSEAEGSRQVAEVLRATVEAARRDGHHTLIWSSESFFDRPEKALPGLQALVDDGVDVEIVAYLRNHASWSRSAYLQWGIRHKTLPGRIRPFREYVAARRPLFLAKLRRYADAFPGKLTVRNFDRCGDVVADFLKVAGLEPLQLVPARENTTAGDAELLLRALFNGQFKEPTLPAAFNRAAYRHIRDATTPAEFLSALLPTEGDLAEVRSMTQGDAAEMNRMLAEQGQPPLVFDATARSAAVDRQRLLLMLTSVALRQAARIAELEAWSANEGSPSP